jgi:hypothetical protein
LCPSARRLVLREHHDLPSPFREALEHLGHATPAADAGFARVGRNG